MITIEKNQLGKFPRATTHTDATIDMRTSLSQRESTMIGAGDQADVIGSPVLYHLWHSECLYCPSGSIRDRYRVFEWLTNYGIQWRSEQVGNQLAWLSKVLSLIIIIQWNSVNSTSDNLKTCLTQTKFHGPFLGNDNLLGLSRTFSHNSNW